MSDTAVKTASSWLPLIVTCVAAIGAWFTLKAEADGLKDDVSRLERQVNELQSTKEDLAVICIQRRLKSFYS